MRGKGKGDLEIMREGKISINIIDCLPVIDEEMIKKAREMFR